MSPKPNKKPAAKSKTTPAKKAAPSKKSTPAKKPLTKVLKDAGIKVHPGNKKKAAPAKAKSAGAKLKHKVTKTVTLKPVKKSKHKELVVDEKGFLNSFATSADTSPALTPPPPPPAPTLDAPPIEHHEAAGAPVADSVAPPAQEYATSAPDVGSMKFVDKDLMTRRGTGYVQKYNVREARELGREVRRMHEARSIIDVVVAFNLNLLAVVRYQRKNDINLGEPNGRVMILHTASTPADEVVKMRSCGFRSSGPWSNGLVSERHRPVNDLKALCDGLENDFGIHFMQKASSVADLPVEYPMVEIISHDENDSTMTGKLDTLPPPAPKGNELHDY